MSLPCGGDTRNLTTGPSTQVDGAPKPVSGAGDADNDVRRPVRYSFSNSSRSAFARRRLTGSCWPFDIVMR
jgi:hypothetical protein